MKRPTLATLAAVAIVSTAFGFSLFRVGVAGAEDALPINISYQPGTYTALPFYLASQKGWWKTVGLTPTLVPFPAGPPQVAAAASKSWDVGEAGSPPAVLGAVRYNIVTIGVADDGSSINQVLSRHGTTAALRKDPASLKGQQVLLTANSTGEYAVASCLKHFGLTESDVQIVSMAPAQLVSAFSSGTGIVAGTWTPYANTIRDKANAEVLCTGKDAGVGIPSVLFARDEYARAHPDLVAKSLAVYLHGVSWIRAHPELAEQSLLEFNQQAGSTITLADAKDEIKIHPAFELDEQLKLLDRSHGGSSTATGWFDGIVAFMKSKGSIDQSPDPKSFLTDDYLKLVLKDAKLRQFANARD